MCWKSTHKLQTELKRKEFHQQMGNFYRKHAHPRHFNTAQKKKYRTVKNVSYLYIAFDVCAGIDVKKNKQTQIVHLSSMMETTTSSKIENEQRQII